MKYTLRRSRPKALNFTVRWGSDLRKAEEGTYSMPSGDTAAAALFCYLYAYMVQMEAIYILLPLVMLGRVYY